MNKDITVTKHVTTDFIDDGEVVTSSSAPREDDDLCIRDISISDYLARPYLIGTIVLTAASTPNTVLWSIYGSAALNSNVQWQEKIKNYNLVRGTFCVKVTSNATPFMQYRLLLHYLPCTDFSVDQSYTHSHNANLATKTTQHSVELDARGTSIVMKMPYISPYSFYDVSTARGEWGAYYLSVISPFATGAGDLSATLSVYCWFEDFELAAPLVPQSSGRPKISKSRKIVKLNEETVDKPLSNSLKAITLASDALRTIPTISHIATTVSWAANIAAGVASYFGYSKIPLTSEPLAITNQINRYSACSDGVDASLPMGLTHDNKLAFSGACVPDGVDECSFNYLKSIYSLTRTITWGEADNTGTLLVSQPINPYNVGFISNKIVNGKTCSYISGPPITTMSMLFSQWRGGIRVKLSFVKTQFHTGRLEITFTPAKVLVNPPTLYTSTASFREIVDLSSTNEVELVLPYYLNSNYVDSDTNSGHLTIRVLNALRSPETVADTVPILMYFSGADDFEFQCPKITRALPFTPQSGAGVDITSSHMIGGDPVHSLSTKYSESSVGEHFTSILQLLSRYSPYRPNTTISTDIASNNAVWIWPFARSITYQDGVTGALSGPLVGGDIFSYLMPMYAMYRGSVNLWFGQALNSTLCPPTNINSIPAFGVMPIQSFINGTNASNNYLTCLTTAGGPMNVMGSGTSTDTLAVYKRIPYYGKNHSSFAYSSCYYSSMNTYTDGTQPTHGLAIQFNSSSNWTATGCSRAAANDFQLMYFIGTIPYIVAYS